MATPPQEFKAAEQEAMPTPPPPEEEEEDHFSLAEQIKGTPERSMRNKKKKNRRSHEVHDDMMSVDGSVVSESIASEEIPPPLPPKRVTPSPKKGLSLESQPSMEEEEIEAIPVKVKATNIELFNITSQCILICLRSTKLISILYLYLSTGKLDVIILGYSHSRSR